MKWSFSKTFEFMAGLCFPKHGPGLFTVLKNLIVWMFCSLVKTLKFMAGLRSPTSFVTAQLISRRWRIVLFCSCANFQQRSHERIYVLPQTRSNAFHSLEKLFSSWWYQVFEKHSNLCLGRVPPNTAQFFFSFHGVEEHFRLDVMQPCKKHSSLWLGRAPQHLLSRPSSFRGVEDSFRFDVVQIFNNVQMNGWSCSLKDGPAHFTVLTIFFIWMVWNFSKTLELMAGLCSPKHGPVPFTVLKNLFVWMLNHQVYDWAALPNIPCHGPAQFSASQNRIVLLLCRHLTTFKWTDVCASPNTVQGISRCWRTFSSG